tara:strand:- start:648 stop:830 length:183 start_codon:yes stop_codon:yes gene_type:complete
MKDIELGWHIVQLERANWAVYFNGKLVEAEFASQRDAQDKAERWESDMCNEWCRGENYVI